MRHNLARQYPIFRPCSEPTRCHQEWGLWSLCSPAERKTSSESSNWPRWPLIFWVLKKGCWGRIKTLWKQFRTSYQLEKNAPQQRPRHPTPAYIHTQHTSKHTQHTSIHTHSAYKLTYKHIHTHKHTSIHTHSAYKLTYKHIHTQAYKHTYTPSIQAYLQAILTNIYIKQSRHVPTKTKQTHYNSAPPKQHPKKQNSKNILPYIIESIV